jgi:nucleoside-diphosphate-sugar epimerase
MFNVYGPGQDITKPDQGVVGIFMNMLIKSDRVQVKGSLARFRDLICIDDVVRGWELCLRGNAYNQSFNLGTGEKTTYHDLIYAIARALDKEDRICVEELPGTPGDMTGSVADLSRIRSMLGYSPLVVLAAGLKKMIESLPFANEHGKQN